MKNRKNSEQALAIALAISITAETDTISQRFLELAEQFASTLDQKTTDRAQRTCLSLVKEHSLNALSA